MARFRISRRGNVNIGRVVSKIAVGLIALWAGGTIVNVLGTTMTCTASPFYTGLSLIGWTVENSYNVSGTACQSINLANDTLYTGIVTATNNNAGILGVIGLIAIASIVMEFVQIRMG